MLRIRNSKRHRLHDVLPPFRYPLNRPQYGSTRHSDSDAQYGFMHCGIPSCDQTVQVCLSSRANIPFFITRNSSRSPSYGPTHNLSEKVDLESWLTSKLPLLRRAVFLAVQLLTAKPVPLYCVLILTLQHFWGAPSHRPMIAAHPLYVLTLSLVMASLTILSSTCHKDSQHRQVST